MRRRERITLVPTVNWRPVMSEAAVAGRLVAAALVVLLLGAVVAAVVYTSLS